ncbi:MAG: flippase-like domain-containing protein [Parcubacteria group bacterium]|nr:flippase-like domain-containing protein [Parcubacteria group bacterium]MCR4342538.1 flippase-like domain-containing protein [Patescibacteria group bacterium]
MTFKHYFQFIGLVIFAIVLYRIDINKSLEIALSANVFIIFLSLLLGIPAIILRNIRWQKLLKNEGVNIPFMESLFIYFYAVFWGAITPAKLGELVKILFLNKKHISWGKSAASVIFDRLFDMVTILLLGITGVLLFFKDINGITYVLTAMLGIIIIIILIFVLNKNILKKVLFKILKKLAKRQESITHSKIQDIAEKEIDDLFASFKKPTILIIQNLLITLVAWGFYFFQLYLLTVALNLKIDLLTAFLIAAIITSLNLIPISISGIGTRDISLIFLFSQIGLSSPEAISFSVLILFTFFVNSLFGWLCGFFIEKNPLKVRPSNVS